MTVVTVTSKGHVTLPKEMLEHLGVHAGDKIVVEAMPGCRIIISAMARTSPISNVFGLLKPAHGLSLTIEQMNENIARGWAGEN